MNLFRNYLKKLTTPTTQTNSYIEEDVTDEEYTLDVPARIGWDTESPQPLVGVRLNIEGF